MTPTETAAILRQYNKWLRGNKDGLQLESRMIRKAIDTAVEVLERDAALPTRVTPEQAPFYVRNYSNEAAEGYADGWNNCIKAMEKKSK